MCAQARRNWSARRTFIKLVLHGRWSIWRTPLVQNVQPDRAATVAQAVLQHPNMNETGRLPRFGLYHVGTEVRLTQTLAAPRVVVEGFHFSAEDRHRGDLHASC